METVAAMAWARSVGVRRSRTPLRKVLSQISMPFLPSAPSGRGVGRGMRSMDWTVKPAASRRRR